MARTRASPATVARYVAIEAFTRPLSGAVVLPGAEVRLGPRLAAALVAAGRVELV